MAEVEEKDNTWLIVGICIAAIIVLVVLLKKDETKHLQSGAVAQSNAEVFSKIEKRHTSNNSTAEQQAGK
jgi:preprotein translocase subunit SecG